MPSYAPVTGLALQPQRRSAPAEVEGRVGRIVLHVRLPGAGDDPRVRVHIVLLRCHIPLNVKNELLARLQVLGPPLLLEHRCELGVVDMAAVARLVGRLHAVEHAIWFPGNAQGTHGQPLELAQERGSHIRPILLELHLRLDADVFERALHQLHDI